MADVKQVINQVEQSLADFEQSINQLILFVGKKLQNYKNLSLGEQIAYPTIGAGLLLVLTSIILFII